MFNWYVHLNISIPDRVDKHCRKSSSIIILEWRQLNRLSKTRCSPAKPTRLKKESFSGWVREAEKACQYHGILAIWLTCRKMPWNSHTMATLRWWRSHPADKYWLASQKGSPKWISTNSSSRASISGSSTAHCPATASQLASKIRISGRRRPLNFHHPLQET